MKKIINSFVIALATISIVGCDMNNPNEDKFVADPESGWVEFQNPGAVTNGVVGCGGTQVLVPIVLTAPVNKNGLDVYYTITDVVGTSANVVSTFANVPAGSRNGNLVVTFSENITSSIEFDVVLTSTSRSNVMIGYPGSDIEQTQTVRVNIGADRFLGTYDVLEDNEFEYLSNVTTGTAANELILTNIFDADTASQTRVFVNEDGTLSFPAFLDNFLFTNSAGNVYFEGIQGTADPCTGVINMTFRLRFGAGGASQTAPITTVLTRQ